MNNVINSTLSVTLLFLALTGAVAQQADSTHVVTGVDSVATPLLQPCLTCFTPEQVCSHLNIPACCDSRVDPEINDLLNIRHRNYDFFRSLRDIQPPSILSGGTLTSFTFNTMGFDKKNFVLDADVQYPIAIGGKGMGLHTFHVIPKFTIRIFADDPHVPFGPNGDTSLAVRTPSTIPGLAYYFSFKRWWNPARQWDRVYQKAHPDDVNFGVNRYLGIYVFHHSDGQDGPEITGDYVNIYNGNYGEQAVLEFIYGQQKNYMFKRAVWTPCDSAKSWQKLRKRKQAVLFSPQSHTSIFIKESNRLQVNWRVSLEWHPYAWSNVVFRDLSTLEGFNYPDRTHMLPRLIVHYRLVAHLLPSLVEYLSNGKLWCPITPGSISERWRFMVNASYALDRNYYRGPKISQLKEVSLLGINRRLNASATVYHIVKRSNHVAAFAQLAYLGSDTYNIYFNDSLWTFKFGVAFGFFQQGIPSDKTNRNNP